MANGAVVGLIHVDDSDTGSAAESSSGDSVYARSSLSYGHIQEQCKQDIGGGKPM